MVDVLEVTGLRQIMNSHYRYIEGPLDRTREAWDRFQSSRSGDPEPEESVHFIPALGGCFIVIQEQHQAGLLEALHLAGTTRSEQGDGLLDDFCTWMEEQRVSRPVRRIVGQGGSAPADSRPA